MGIQEHADDGGESRDGPVRPACSTGAPASRARRHAQLALGHVEHAGQHGTAAGENAAGAQGIDHAALAQAFLDEVEQLAGARLQNFGDRAQAAASAAAGLAISISAVCGTAVTTQWPYWRLSSSAWATGICRPTARSLVKCAPPTGTDAVCATAPSKNTTRSLECAPISSRQTPSSRSSAESVASAAAMDSSTASVTSRPARLAQVTVLCKRAAGAGGDVQIDFEPRADHADGIEDAGLIVDDELARQQVQDLAVGRTLDGARTLHGGAHIFARDLAHAAAELEAAVGVEAARCAGRLRPPRTRRCWRGPRVRPARWRP